MAKTHHYIDNKDQLLNVFYKFRDYLQADIQQIEAISIPLAQREAEEFWSGTTTLETTGQDGNAVKIADGIFESRCTVPLCMLIFSGIDFLGRMARVWSELWDPEKKGDTSFATHAKLFFEILAQTEDLKKSDRAVLLEKKFRHSLAHSFLPVASDLKYSYTIAYRSPNVTAPALFIEESERLILNVQYLSVKFKAGLDTFERKINEGDNLEQLIGIFNDYLDEFN